MALEYEGVARAIWGCSARYKTRAVGYESVMRAVRHVFPSLCAPYTGPISSTPVRNRIIHCWGCKGTVCGKLFGIPKQSLREGLTKKMGEKLTLYRNYFSFRKSWLVYGLHRVPLYPHCHPRTDSTNPTLPPLSNVNQLLKKQGHTVIFGNFLIRLAFVLFSWKYHNNAGISWL